jgi:hypothetical protein
MIIHQCRREAVKTEALHFTRLPQARHDAPLPVGFSAHDALNKARYVCARQRIGEPAGS